MEKGKVMGKTNNEIMRKMNSIVSYKNFMHSPAQLAYAGDAVYELLVRSYIVDNYECSVNKMHRIAVRFVKAKTQANIIKELDYILTDEERKIVKRGRNSKVTSSPKNVDFMDYRYATGFEALFGHLYLNHEIDRLLELFNKTIEILKKEDKDEDNRGKKSSN